jgi:hypothetical protein
VAEVFVEFPGVLIDDNVRYRAHACGAETPGGMWQGWLEFLPLDGGPPIRSGRETTQPNRTDAVYWATGLTPVYLEGALRRALTPLILRNATPSQPAFEEPAETLYTSDPVGSRPAVLNPFSVYEKGEALLRQQLAALSAWHLVNIIEAYRLSNEPSALLSRLPGNVLIERIVSGVSR